MTRSVYSAIKNDFNYFHALYNFVMYYNNKK